jgi:Iron/manganese superoxide dismutases, C-terminal domain
MLNYLHYESHRLDYLKTWWSVVDWEEATHSFELSDENSIAELLEFEVGVSLDRKVKDYQ